MGDSMKKMVAVVGGLAILSIGSYPLFGMMIEKELRHQVEAAPKQYGMSLSIREYHRHWFYSQAKVVWEWHIPAHLTQNHLGQTVTVSPKDMVKEFDLDILHGPVILKPTPFFGIGYAKTSIDWPLMNKSNGEERYDKASVYPKLELSLATNFLLQTHWKTTISHFKLISQDQTQQLLWDGMVFENLMDRTGKHLKGQADLTGFDLVKPDMQVNLKGAQSNYDFEREKEGLYVGHAQFDIHQLHMQNNNQQVFDLEDLVFTTNTDLDNEEFTTQLVTHFDKLNIDSKPVGPFDIDLKIEKVNAQVLARINQLFQQEQNASPSFRQKNMWSMLSNVPELLKYGMVMQINKLHVVFPNGFIDSHGTMDLPLDISGQLNLQRLQTVKGQLEVLISKDLFKNWLIDLVQRQMLQEQLSLDPSASSTDIHEIAVSRTSKKLTDLEQSGVLKAQSSEFLINIQFHDGQLTVNQLPFDPSWLMI